MRNFFSLFSLFTLFFSFSCYAIRTNPRSGRPVWTMIRQSTPQPIEAADAVAGVITIDQPGNYELYEDLSSTVSLTVNDICLDLNGYTIEQTNADENVIQIAADTNNILIFNGNVQNIGASGAGSGILVAESTKNIFIQDVRFYGCATGITIAGLSTQEVLFSQIVDCNFVSCLAGIKADYCQDLLIEKVGIENDSTAVDSGTGISLQEGISNVIIDEARIFKYEYGITLGKDSTTFEVVGCKIFNCDLEDMTRGIFIRSAKKINIKDTTIRKSATAGSGYGILGAAFLSPDYRINDVQIDNVSILGADTGGFDVGIFLRGRSGYKITNCEIINCTSIDNTIGFKFEYADNNVIQNCVAQKNSMSGFELSDSETNSFQNCQALDTISTSSAAGFKSDSGKGNLFEGCVAKKTITTAIDFGNTAHGFLLTGVEEDTKIINCIINGTEATSEGNALAYGVQLQPTLLPDVGMGTLVGLDSYGRVEDWDMKKGLWSPCSKYILATSEGDNSEGTKAKIILFGFDETYVSAIYWKEFLSGPTKPDHDPSWSPDGRHISYCDESTTEMLVVERRDGARLVPVATFNEDADFSVTRSAWSGNGMFVAYVRSDLLSPPTSFVYIRDFDGENLPNRVSDGLPYNSILGIAWSPDDRFIAVAHAAALEVILFSEGGHINGVGSEASFSDLTAVAWSPNGKFIAAGDATRLHVYSYSGPGEAFTHLDSETIGSPVTSIAWSPDGKYIVNNGSSNGNTYINVSKFDPDLAPGARIDHIADAQMPGSTPPAVLSVDWSSCGSYVLAATEESIVGGKQDGRIVIFPVMYGPTNCLLEKNTIVNTKADKTLLGVGVGAGGANSFFDNICYNNEDDYSYGIPNVFYDDQDRERPFDNIATQRARYLMNTELFVDTRPSNMA